MNNPGVYTLFAGEITTALTSEAASPVVDLAGINAITIVAKLAYGSGGTSIAAKVQTSFDGGTTWLDVALFTFATASLVKVALIPTGDSGYSDEYSNLETDGLFYGGLFGDRLRAIITSVGTYGTGTVLDIRASVR